LTKVVASEEVSLYLCFVSALHNLFPLRDFGMELELGFGDRFGAWSVGDDIMVRS
jgi:hypothetical protein